MRSANTTETEEDSSMLIELIWLWQQSLERQSSFNREINNMGVGMDELQD